MELGIKIMKAKQEDILIAEFMGWSYLHEINEFQDLVGQKFHKEVYYSTSWDWLMPVVEMIKSKMVERKHLGAYVSFESRLKDASWIGIEATYKTVVEFIKWYNENN